MYTSKEPAPELTKLQRFKKWTSQNADLILSGAITLGVAGAGVYLFREEMKSETERVNSWNERATKENAWLTEQVEAGKDVYFIEDRYLVLDRETPREIRMLPPLQ